MPPLVAQRLGVLSGCAVALTSLGYAVVLTIGLATLPSPDVQIQDPWFTLMELLILALAPAMVAWSVALHARVSAERKPLALASVAFMSLAAVVTCAVHFAVLTLSRDSAFADQDWARRLFSFEWPSVAYALDILAWDFLFPLAALFAAGALEGDDRAVVVRRLLIVSAALAFVGLAGVPIDNLQVRNIGILGYAVLYPLAAAWSVRVFRQVS